MKRLFLILFFVVFILNAQIEIIGNSNCLFLQILKEIDKNIAINKNLQKHNIDSKIILALIKKESNFNQFAISEKNAYGLMQLLLPTAKIIETDTDKCNIFDIEKNIRIGIKHLDNLSKKENSQRDVLQKYYWGNKKQLHKYYYWDIIRISKKIKVKNKEVKI